MSDILNEVTKNEYKYGFVTDIESDKAPVGLNEDIIRLMSCPCSVMDARVQTGCLDLI